MTQSLTTRIRYWLIKKLAGRDPVILNFVCDREEQAFYTFRPGGRELIWNVEAKNWPIGWRIKAGTEIPDGLLWSYTEGST